MQGDARRLTSSPVTRDSDDELTATSGGFTNSYSYNSNGERTGRTLSGTSSTLAFDYDGQCTSITTGSAVVSFVYDALGRRFSRAAGGTTTDFLSGVDGSIWLEKQGSTTSATYTWGDGLCRKDTEYPLIDGLGSERTVTNSSQTVTGTLNLDAFGNQVGSTGSSSDPYMFAASSAYRNDGDCGLMHVGARYYDAQAGRFITRDSELDQHPYAYCNNDPVDAVDPSGHDPAWRLWLPFLAPIYDWWKKMFPPPHKKGGGSPGAGGGSPGGSPGGGTTGPGGGPGQGGGSTGGSSGGGPIFIPFPNGGPYTPPGATGPIYIPPGGTLVIIPGNGYAVQLPAPPQTKK